MELINQLDASISRLSEVILSTANPALAPAQRATAAWPMMSLQAALAWCGVYAVIVGYGLLTKPSAASAKGAAGGKPAAETTLDVVVKRIQVVYNSAQVALCMWMMTSAVLEARKVGIATSLDTLVCNKFNASATGIATVLWVFYLSKILDFFDTIFMVVRGKFEQFSFLHVYHHFTIFLTYWLVTSVGYDGDVYYTVVANSFVHLVMYYYYLVASVGAKPWWGKYVTQLQMGQFLTMNAQAAYILYNNCAYPHAVTWFYLIYIISLFALFNNFNSKRWAKKPEGGKKGQ